MRFGRGGPGGPVRLSSTGVGVTVENNDGAADVLTGVSHRTGSSPCFRRTSSPTTTIRIHQLTSGQRSILTISGNSGDWRMESSSVEERICSRSGEPGGDGGPELLQGRCLVRRDEFLLFPGGPAPGLAAVRLAESE